MKTQSEWQDTLIRLQVEHLPGDHDPKAGGAVVIGRRCHRRRCGPLVAVVPASLRSRGHLPPVQTDAGLEHPEDPHPQAADRWTWLVIAAHVPALGGPQAPATPSPRRQQVHCRCDPTPVYWARVRRRPPYRGGPWEPRRRTTPVQVCPRNPFDPRADSPNDRDRFPPVAPVVLPACWRRSLHGRRPVRSFPCGRAGDQGAAP